MHKTNRRAIFVATILLLLSNSAGAMFESREKRLQAIKTVGIIAAVGDKFTFAKGGLHRPR